MKLRNKKTGEIRNIKVLDTDEYLVEREVTTWRGEPLTLAELNEEWEDSKGFWSINGDATIEHFDRLDENDLCKEIGNYFETKEEAEKAVEKLKAWKRLRGKGFRFNDFVGDAIYYELSDEEIEKDDTREDLDLLFSQEDD
jgi:hypothetical protein